MTKKYTLKLDADQITMVGTAIQLAVDYLGDDINLIVEDKLTMIDVHQMLQKIVKENQAEFLESRQEKMRKMFGDVAGNEIIAILDRARDSNRIKDICDILYDRSRNRV